MTKTKLHLNKCYILQPTVKWQPAAPCRLTELEGLLDLVLQVADPSHLMPFAKRLLSL